MKIIVIDGPAGSGKSTTAKAIAKKLGIQYLDSGAIYRAVTFIWLGHDKPAMQPFFDSLSGFEFEFKFDQNLFRVYLNGEEITDKIRSEIVTEHVSDLATDWRIRQFVNDLMRNCLKNGSFIADGRDLGTAVFPDACIKFYMDASVEERAKRRFQELKDSGMNVSVGKLKQQIQNRDQKDSSRNTDPLKMADDAILIDTTNLSFEEQVDKMCSIIKNKQLTKT